MRANDACVLLIEIHDLPSSLTVQVKQSIARESAGMLRWHGDWETLRQIAEDDEQGIMESP